MYELKSLDKKFPGVHALKAIDFHIKRGEIVGLVGENGAGKSTLMKVIYGAYQPDGGQILINGDAVRFANPRQAMEKGIGMVFQEQSLIPNLTVMENIFLGYEQQFVRLGVINWKEMAKAAKAQLAKVKLDIDPSTVTSKLSFAQRQLVELAKVLTLEERVDGDLVILLDEPTSVLSKDEVELLFKLVRELVTRASFIFVSHRMDEVMELSDRIYVMKDGQVVDVVERGGGGADANRSSTRWSGGTSTSNIIGSSFKSPTIPRESSSKCPASTCQAARRISRSGFTPVRSCASSEPKARAVKRSCAQSTACSAPPADA
ncbi:ATP-binding cassette domain-containing protein [Sinorhizobium meliloti]|uniref:ATP-binding cassette domain-containing protein n=1 Tax=Rhizobium meliloti TaxID=382 RepID=UPI001F1A5C81|nr:ATP-binding cassette domain-containing protein [Sinorhizobium meliloti]